VSERDLHTGHALTGHEWNGIKELNTAVPKMVWLSLFATVLFSIAYWVLMPAWPLGRTYTKGLLGADVRQELALSLQDAASSRSVWASRVEEEDFAAIVADDQLMRHVRDTGKALFGNNCAVCHGSGAGGGPGFPNLVDDAWLWGGTPDAVFETIRVGINAEHPETRVGQMLAFGRDGMLDRQAILDAVAYVRSLSHPELANGADAGKIAAGRQVFADNCASCHGDDAKGSEDVGAPDLTDASWLYGGEVDAIYRTVWGGRAGHMPAWEGLLSVADRKILTLYVLDLKREAP
jgi:cytochrome c oxidase cbb3-type subunit 3